MSLYYEAATFLTTNTSNNNGILFPSRVYSTKGLKSKPAHIVALLSEAAKWSASLSVVVENSDILVLERKLTPPLALLLTHDLLLSKRGIAAPRDHILRTTIEKHKARLTADFTKARIKAGFPTLELWRDAINVSTSDEDGEEDDPAQVDGTKTAKPRLNHPRWIRMNTLKTTLASELTTTFSHLKSAPLSQLIHTPRKDIYALDDHIPNLIAVPTSLDSYFTTSAAYRSGRIIFQDKASCFSAYLLDPRPGDGDVVDACAAPGNKTTHLAALLHVAQTPITFSGKSSSVEEAEKAASQPQHIYACERDKTRSLTLTKMLRIAGAAATSNDHTGFVQALPNQDFLRLNPQDPRMRNVGALLLDPSCSGSGIVGRDENEEEVGERRLRVVLPRSPAEIGKDKEKETGKMRGKKRKHGAEEKSAPPSRSTPSQSAKSSLSTTSPLPPSSTVTTTAPVPSPSTTDLTTRLTSLSSFQLLILLHALSFPSARKVIYSTCSIHVFENELVVLKALHSPIAQKRGWRMLKREEQVDGLRKWDKRGVVVDDVDGVGGDTEVVWTKAEAQAVANACIRCEKGTEDGTMGFFVAGFVRDGNSSEDRGLLNSGNSDAEVTKKDKRNKNRHANGIRDETGVADDDEDREPPSVGDGDDRQEDQEDEEDDEDDDDDEFVGFSD